MMITVLVVGILATVAIPAYQTYTVRSTLKEGFDFLQTGKLLVEDYYVEQGRTKLSQLTAANFEAETGLVKNVNTSLINDYWIAPWNGNDISIWFRTKVDAPLFPELQNKWLFYLVGKITYTEIEWTCESDFEDPAFKKYVPYVCR